MKRLKNTLVMLASWGLLLPAPVSADVENQPTPDAQQVRDVQLDRSGALHVQVMTPEGAGCVGQTVKLLSRGATIQSLATDRAGNVRFDGVRGGAHQMVVGEECLLLRIWTPTAAPPVATEKLLVVSSGRVMRGQQPIRGLIGKEPLMIGILVAAAIAIPIAVHDSGS